MMKKSLLLTLLAIALIPIISACGGGGGGGGGSDGGGGCDLVASVPNSDSFLEVDNTLSTGIEWYLADYAFGAFLRPGECTLFGVQANRASDLVVTLCTSPSDVNCPNNGTERTINFSVADNDTYAIVVNNAFF